VQWIDAGPDEYEETDEQGNRFPALHAYRDNALQGESVRIMQVLKRFEGRNGGLSYVEFPDWGGAGFASIQEKKLGIAFKNACLAVRLHTADSILSAMEARYMSQQDLALYDLERKCLADADVVVAQLPGVARAMREFFDLDESEWIARLRVHAPPVLLDGAVAAVVTVQPDLDTSIVFSSKIQHIKRPEPFVRACSGFVRERPDYRGQVIVLAHAFDAVYLASVKALIPPDLVDRFLFIHSASNTERQKVIGNSICVFTSAFESFCLAAYEASMAGALCVVNSGNPAFDEMSPWITGKNCEKFDGTTADLLRALRRIFDRGRLPQEPAHPPHHAWPWASLPEVRQSRDDQPMVSVLITHFNLGIYLEEALDSVLASDYPNLEVVIVDDASSEPVSRALIERLEAVAHQRLHVIRLAANGGKAGARNVALRAAKGELVLHLDANDIIHPRFISTAVRGLVNNDAYAFVVPQTGYFDAEHPGLSAAAPKTFSVVIGEARASGLHRNLFSMGTMLARKSVLDGLPYNEDLSRNIDWELCLRALAAGHRFIVTNAVQFFRRDRITAAATETSSESRAWDLSLHDVVRRQYICLGAARIPLYAVRSGGSIHIDDDRADQGLRARLDMYERSEIVFAALTMANVLQKSAPWALRWIRGAARLVWRARKRLKKPR
jgi:glycosyltransferase involved in cell wall biosynthesis